MGKARVALILIFLSGILCYGYWASKTYGYFYLTLSTPTQKILKAQVQFLDEQHSVLAEGHSDETYGIVTAKHPEVGYCDELESQAWKICSDKQAKWAIQWVPKVKYLNISGPHCELRLLPVQIRTYADDWWLWWVPLPHVGGRPLTSFHFDISITDKSECP